MFRKTLFILLFSFSIINANPLSIASNFVAKNGHRAWFVLALYLMIKAAQKFNQKEPKASIEFIDQLKSKLPGIPPNKLAGSALILSSIIPILFGYLHKIAYGKK